MREQLGCQIKQASAEKDYLYCRLMGLECTVGSHDFENDRDCDFESFKYEANLRSTWHNSNLRSIQIETLAIVAFVLHEKLDIHQGLFVYEESVVIARYEMKNSHWIDRVSDSIVEYPQHLLDLRDRAKIR